ncbi:MAG: hypothetical protein K8U57_05065 [Planctomycetes bacterium]|nr:hypothetical protein [Planctomycetota bacterium]
MLRPALGIAAVVSACLACTGCALLEGSSLFKNGIGGDPVGQNWKKVKTPGDPKIPADHLETSQQVEMLGRRINTQNVFTGIEPHFYMMDIPEVALYHRGTEELFISKGLVKKCKTEAELAAVLCTELGQMIAEKRGVKRAGGDRDTIPDAALPGGAVVGGGTPTDLGREAEIAYHERRHPRGAKPASSDNPAKLSRELLKGAGFDEAELDRVEPLLRQSKRGVDLQKQMSDSATPPKWDH